MYQKQEVAKLSETLEKVADGDLSVQYNVADSDADTADVRSSFQAIADATNATVGTLAQAKSVAEKVAQFQEMEVDKLSTIMQEVADGNLTEKYQVAHADEDTTGVATAFGNIAEAVNATLVNLNGVIGQVTESAAQFNEGSRVIA
ncbi:MAG: hypothetical protein HQ567_14255 [Candidatus Nealsonbacteria bacterium]|nr:hypothetical protein [Candidatus Nealsonbacteria bacterium]